MWGAGGGGETFFQPAIQGRAVLALQGMRATISVSAQQLRAHSVNMRLGSHVCSSPPMQTWLCLVLSSLPTLSAPRRELEQRLFGSRKWGFRSDTLSQDQSGSLCSTPPAEVYYSFNSITLLQFPSEVLLQAGTARGPGPGNPGGQPAAAPKTKGPFEISVLEAT